MINPAQINSNNSKRNYKQGEIPFENLSEACLNKKLGIPVIYRSSYELKFIEYLEGAVQTGKVKRWGSEITAIPYYDSKGKKHRYFPDFYVEIFENISKNEPNYSENFSGQLIGLNENKVLKKILLEIKPKNQTKNINEQIAGKNLSLKSRKYLTNTYDINVRKWRAAQELCSQKGIEFKIITENTIWRL
jgi:head completion protein